MRWFQPKLNIRLALILVAFMALHLCAWLYKGLFDRLDATIIDRLTAQAVKSDAAGMTADRDLVFIDANFYYQRAQHARIIENLAKLGVQAQLVDFIFPEKVGDEDDRPLVQAAALADNVYFGMAFEALERPGADDINVLGGFEPGYPQALQWRPSLNQPTGAFYEGRRPRIPFAELSSVSRGIGFLNLKPDADGVLRRSPLLVTIGDAVYPSFALRAVCDYLKVSPADVIVYPGKHILLKNAQIPAAGVVRDLVIPIDMHGNLLIKFTGAWHRIRHFSYSEIEQAAGDAKASAKLADELAGKIAILTEKVAADLKVPPVNEKSRLSAGVAHALIIQNILSENFLIELSDWAMIVIELVLLSAVLLLSLHLTPIGLFCGALVITGVYSGIGAFLFVKSDVILQFARPVLMVGSAALMIIVAMALERAVLFARTVKAKQLAERELEIGRQIQSGFFPTALPDLKGWQIATHFAAARHVAGDFYDAFCIGDRKHIGVVIADVCDKGVGAALYMALFRSLIRILSGAADSLPRSRSNTAGFDSHRVLSDTVRTLNDYISVTHEKDGMFATLLFGILDPESGEFCYINGGHEPPMLLGRNGIKARLNPTGPAVGAFAYSDFEVGTINFEPGDVLFGYTDGVVDARNQNDEPFTNARLLAAVSAESHSPGQLIAEIKERIEAFTHGKEQFDDITLIALGRQPVDQPLAVMSAGRAN